MNLNKLILTLSLFRKNLSLAKTCNNSNSFFVKKFQVNFFLINKLMLSNQMIDHSAVDYPHLKKRFLLYYSFVNYFDKTKTFFFQKISNNTKSLFSVYPSAEWLERESYDFFGIFYQNNPDLRRILSDYGFPSYALRKDFPVTGFFDIVYSIASKKIQFKEIEFQQSFRVFIKENPYKK